MPGGGPGYARIDRLHAQRARLLGLYAPEKTELSGPGGSALRVQNLSADASTMTDEELRALIAKAQ